MKNLNNNLEETPKKRKSITDNIFNIITEIEISFLYAKYPITYLLDQLDYVLTGEKGTFGVETYSQIQELKKKKY
jgi:hypothetical protein